MRLPAYLYSGMPPFKGPSVGTHHTRAEYGIRFARDQGAVELSQDIRRVLPVAMEQNNDVEALLNEIAVAKLFDCRRSPNSWGVSAPATWAHAKPP